MNRKFKEAVWRGNFRPTESAYKLEEKVRSRFGFRYRYDAARLFIGRSMAETETLSPLKKGMKFRNSLSGELLFGDDIDLWLCALILDARFGDCETMKVEHLKNHIEAHWHRGANIIGNELEECKDDLGLMTRLASFLPERGTENATSINEKNASSHASIQVPLGPISRTFEDDEAIDFCLNGPGISPHLALMGRTRSGKTTTGIQMTHSIVRQSSAPILLIDPQGSFVSEGQLNHNFPKWHSDVQAIEVGTNPIPLDFLPSPNVGNTEVQNAAMTMRDSICKCCNSPGDLMRSDLLKVIENVIHQSNHRGLESIKSSYNKRLEKEGKAMDSISSRLDELTRFSCFDPQNAPDAFFKKSWIISLRQINSEELKRLVMLLLLDATAMYFLARHDASLQDGFRQIRQIVIIDEARKILKERRSDSLIQLISRSAVKGLSVILISQDPSDFEGHDYDFTTQLGAVISFCCNQTQRGLRSLQGAFGRKLQAEEFSDSYLESGVAFAKLPRRHPMRIRCWKPH